MKAIQLSGIDHLALVDIVPPVPGPGEVLIRTGASTICTSDIHDLRANPFGINFPVILGHEGAGTVVATGAGVRDLIPGQRAAAHPVHHCGACRTCLAGMPHLCEHMGHFGLNMQGTFAELFVARADRVRALPDSVPFTTGALMEPVCVCLEALAQARHGPGRRLLILGDGPFGAIMARLAAHEQGAQVVIAGHHDNRLAQAGSARTINLRAVEDPARALAALGGGAGFDAVILAVANPSAVALSLSLLNAMGRLVVFAPIPGETPIDLFEVLRRELEIVGAVNDRDRLDDAVMALADPLLDLGSLVTHTFKLEEHAEAFRAAERDRAAVMKVAFVFDEVGTE
jgi:2-desacetyl-2-hydroxyethyl bacteriochlorophyllide A dehydrogenase